MDGSWGNRGRRSRGTTPPHVRVMPSPIDRGRTRAESGESEKVRQADEDAKLSAESTDFSGSRFGQLSRYACPARFRYGNQRA